MSSETEIRPFRVNMPDEAIGDLQRRIAATRLPSKELAGDRSQGVQLATIQELARNWTTGYDWRKCEASRNALRVHAWLRLLWRTGRGRLEPRPHRASVGGADAPPRLHPIRRQGGDQGAWVTD
jgi:hypothetical protein